MLIIPRDFNPGFEITSITSSKMPTDTSTSRSAEEQHRGLRRPFPFDNHSGASGISLHDTNSVPTTPTHKRHRSANNFRTSPTESYTRASPSKSVVEHVEEEEGEEEELIESRPLTPMEEKEKREGSFSGEPLDVEDGVAVTEEAVTLHVPDIITQF